MFVFLFMKEKTHDRPVPSIEYLCRVENCVDKGYDATKYTPTNVMQQVKKQPSLNKKCFDIEHAADHTVGVSR